MRPIRVTVSSQASSDPIILDHYIGPFNVGLGVTVNGSLTYKVEHTFDDPFAADFNPATATWFDNATLVGQTASADGNYAFPVTAIRLTATAYTNGSATLTALQAGRPGE